MLRIIRSSRLLAGPGRQVGKPRPQSMVGCTICIYPPSCAREALAGGFGGLFAKHQRHRLLTLRRSRTAPKAVPAPRQPLCEKTRGRRSWGPDTPEKKPADKGARCARARYTTGVDHRTNLRGDRGRCSADLAASSMIGRLTSEAPLSEVFRQDFRVYNRGCKSQNSTESGGGFLPGVPLGCLGMWDRDHS